MNEQEILDDIFDSHNKFKGQKIWYCELCDTFSIGCPKNCTGSSCNGGGCPSCLELIKKFNQLKTSPQDYLTAEEQKVIYKFRQLKKFIPESIERGEKEINWQYLYENGKLSGYDEEVFAEFLKDKHLWKAFL